MAEKKQENSVVHAQQRTNPTGIIVAFAAVALFVGASAGFIGSQLFSNDAQAYSGDQQTVAHEAKESTTDEKKEAPAKTGGEQCDDAKESQESQESKEDGSDSRSDSRHERKPATE